MQEKEEARNRIRKRRSGGNSSIRERGEGRGFYYSKLFYLVFFIIFGLVFCLLVFPARTLRYVQMGRIFIQETIPWHAIIPFENWKPRGEEQVVGATELYQRGDAMGYYTNDTNAATSLGDGLVVYIGENKNRMFVIVSHDNGVSVTYGNLENSQVSLYDRVLKGDNLGLFEKEIILEAMKDNTDLDMEEVFVLFED